MRVLSRKGLALSLSGVLLAGFALAAGEPATLTRAQWLKKIGGSASDRAVLQETLGQLAPADRVEFARRVIKAISRMPVTPEEKGAAFVGAAIDCIKGKLGDVKKDVIAEIFAEMPMSYLPLITEELSKRFDAELNGLSDEAYDEFATGTIDIAAVRNKKTDEPSVRDTFVVLVFLRASKNADKLTTKLVARFPDAHTRQVVTDLAPGALASGKYGDVLNAAGVELPPISLDSSLLNLIGHVNLDRLLADMNTYRGLKEAIGAGETDPALTLQMPLRNVRTGGITPLWESYIFTHPKDVGVERVPRFFATPVDQPPVYAPLPEGYQNQGTSIIYPVKPVLRRKHGVGGPAYRGGGVSHGRSL